MKTKTLKISEIEKDWWIADAESQILGRLASKIAQILRGKHKVNFVPHMDNGDCVVVINAEKIMVTGKTVTSYGSGYLKWKSKQKQRKPQFIRQETKNNAAKTNVNLKEEREKTLSFEDHFKNSIIDSNDNVLQYMTSSSDATKRDDFKF